MNPKQPTINMQFLCDQAFGFHQKGNLAEAEQLYLQILAIEPVNFMARHLLGVIRSQQGRNAEALELIGAALKMNSNAAEALSNYGNVLRALGRFEEALASYDKALAIKPDFAEAQSNRGNTLRDLKRFEEALASYERALAIKSDDAVVLANRGNTLRDLKRPDEALASYDRALAIQPGFADALNNRGSTLRDLHRPGEALASYDKALAIEPDYAEALNNRGVILWELNRPEDALASYERALAVRPGFGEALCNRGVVLWGLKRPEEALASYDKALAIEPGLVEALNNRGVTLSDLKRSEEALASFDKALAIEPLHARAWNNRGSTLRDLKRVDEALASFGMALKIDPGYVEALLNRGTMQWFENRNYEAAVLDLEQAVSIDPEHDYARGDLLHLRMYGGDWRDFERDAALVNAGVRAGKHTAKPFVYQAIAESPANMQICSTSYASLKYPPLAALWTKTEHRHSKIRVGYLSGEFREHATAYLTAGLYESHDKSKFEIIAFDNGRSDALATRKRLEASFDDFIDISGLSDAGAAQRIAAKEIDILVNLNGYFGEQRMGVFAHKPAPLQVSYLGFPATLGASYMDYILADRFVIPEGEQQYYMEKVVWLPDTYQANDSKRFIAKSIPSRAESGLPEKAFVFCSFNQSYKLTPAMFAVWMRILKQVEGSVLWILECNAKFPENLRREAARRGVAGERLVFAQHLPVAEHLARMSLADLFLDSLPCNAHTTASDALWAGLPLITCRGNTFAGRVASSLLHAIGLTELITNDLEQYETLAVKLAGDATLLQSFRQKLQNGRFRTPLFDTDRFRRHIETAYTTMWEIFQCGEPPRSFSVVADEA